MLPQGGGTQEEEKEAVLEHVGEKKDEKRREGLEGRRRGREERERGGWRGGGWISCLADSNLTAIREERVRDLPAWGGGLLWWCWGDVIYALLHTETSLCVCVCACAHMCVTSFFYIQFSLSLNGLSLSSPHPLSISPHPPSSSY